MKKSDKSIHNICIAAIKRSTMKPYDFKWTRLYEQPVDFRDLFPGIGIECSDGQLVICSTIIDHDNFSILTTQRLIIKEKGLLFSGSLNGAIDKQCGNFKDYKNEPLTFGLVRLYDGSELKYFIETGKASMVMIYGVRTIIRTGGTTNSQMNALIYVR